MKYDWIEWALVRDTNGIYQGDSKQPQVKTEAVTRRVYENFRELDRDIVVSLSSKHSEQEDAFVTKYCNLWRLTGDIHASYSRMIAPFKMEQRLQLTHAGCYGDLDMLQIGPLGKPNQAETVFKPSPLKPAEQYLQVSLWALLTQPLLLSCNIPTMDDFDLGLVRNDEVLAVNQDPLVSQGYRIRNRPNDYEIWGKKLADGSIAVGLFNLAKKDQVLTVDAKGTGFNGRVRDLWRQKDIGNMAENGGAFRQRSVHTGLCWSSSRPSPSDVVLEWVDPDQRILRNLQIVRSTFASSTRTASSERTTKAKWPRCHQARNSMQAVNPWHDRRAPMGWMDQCNKDARSREGKSDRRSGRGRRKFSPPVRFAPPVRISGRPGPRA